MLIQVKFEVHCHKALDVVQCPGAPSRQGKWDAYLNIMYSLNKEHHNAFGSAVIVSLMIREA